MRHLTRFSIWIIFSVFISANIYIFIQSIKLSDKINRFEKEIKILHQENLTLENKIYDVDSLKYASSMAAQLEFIQKAQPVYLENLQYARNQ